MNIDVRELYDDTSKYMNKEVTVCGWIRNHRKQKDFGFIDFSDGTDFKHLQIVYDKELDNFEEITKFLVGSAIKATGTIIESSGSQDFEMKLKNVVLEGDCPSDFPI